MKFEIIWRKESSLINQTVEAENAGEAYDKFKTSNPGGGIPVSSTTERVNEKVVRVTNSSGRCLVMIVEVA